MALQNRAAMTLDHPANPKAQALRMGAAAALLALLVAACLAPAAAAQLDRALYQASAYVTGTDLRQRPDGLARCLAQVLVKVSGDPAVADNPALPALQARAAEFMRSIAYLDRMSDIPHHDEQGSRDRPYDLIVRFSPDGIAQALSALGRAPWKGPRPPLVVLATMARQGQSMPVSADGHPDERPRAALLAAGDHFGMEVALPTLAQLQDGAAQPETLVPGFGPDAVGLFGTLVWSDAAHGWVARWRMRHAGRERAWQAEGVSYDAAFRAGIAGAMGILSGHR